MESPPATSAVDAILPLAGLRRFRLWVGFLVCFFAGVGWLFGRMQAAERFGQDRAWRDMLDPVADDPGLTPADDLPVDRARRVAVGIYLEHITEVSIRDSRWQAQCEVWFSWQGDGFDPAAHLVVVDGTVNTTALLEQADEGERHYRRYRIAVTIAKTFHIHHFPLDRHLLVIAFEDGSVPRDRLVFEPDRLGSAISSRAAVHGYRFGPLEALEKPHSYKTSQGRPDLTRGMRATFSQARFGVLITRDSWGPFVKMFHALFVAVAIALLPFFVRPTDLDPRFGLGVGALFAAVANSYLVGAMVPDTGEFSLADVINLLGIVTILLTLVESTVSLHLFDHCGQQALAVSLDRTSFLIISLGFTAAVVLILAGASGLL
ncbi:MAG: hypothetical protein EBX36_07945 [Planctomycetia bacterium]|nr:hypothetical protein [Planctomycetia bacterium]